MELFLENCKCFLFSQPNSESSPEYPLCYQKKVISSRTIFAINERKDVLHERCEDLIEELHAILEEKRPRRLERIYQDLLTKARLNRLLNEPLDTIHTLEGLYENWHKSIEERVQEKLVLLRDLVNDWFGTIEDLAPSEANADETDEASFTDPPEMDIPERASNAFWYTCFSMCSGFLSLVFYTTEDIMELFNDPRGWFYNSMEILSVKTFENYIEFHNITFSDLGIQF